MVHILALRRLETTAKATAVTGTCGSSDSFGRIQLTEGGIEASLSLRRVMLVLSSFSPSAAALHSCSETDCG